MAEALYRTYRPKTFADVVDQQHIRITLQHALDQDRVAHAYLFAGPRGVGKTTLARIFARAVNCTERKKGGEPCNKCINCQTILANRSLDIIEIDAASQTGVDNVRENIIQSAHSIPSMALRKVFIIDEVHMLSTAAFNALLKLLEEPPAHAMFILATTEIHRIPETIISRTQRFDFKKIGIDDIVQRLLTVATAEKRQVDEDVARRIARRAGGSIRDAESMLGQLFSFEEKRITGEIADLVLPRSDQQLILDLLDSIMAGRTVEALDRFHTFCDEGGDVDNFVNDLILTSRAMLLSTVSPGLVQQVANEFDRADIKRLHDMSGQATPSQVVAVIEAFLTAQRRLSKAVMIELPVELAIITLTAGRDVASKIVEPEPSKKISPSKPPDDSSTVTPLSSSTQTKPAASTGQLTLQAVRDVWRAIQRSICHTHPSLGLTVQHATIGEVSDEEVIIHVPFKLHADRLSDPKYSAPLKQALDDALGQSVRISVMITEVAAEPPVEKRTVPTTATPVESGGTSAPIKAPAKGDLWDQVVSSFS